MGDITRRQRKRAIALHVAAVQARTRALYGTARMAVGDPLDKATGGGGDDDAAKAAAEKAATEAAAAAAAAAKGDGGKDDEPTEAELAALGDAGRRALERIRLQRDEKAAEAAKLAEKAAAYDKLEEANKTEQQRKDEAAAAAQRLADDSALKLAKLEAALEAGLPHTAAARLVGTTKDELLKDAKAYKAELEAAAPPPRRRTTSDADKGGEGPTGGMSSLIRQRAGRTG